MENKKPQFKSELESFLDNRYEAFELDSITKDEFKVILTSVEILIMDMRANLERSESALNKYREKVE